MRSALKTICSSPQCEGKRVRGRNFCKVCAKNLDRIRKEFEDDPKLLYNQRSDNPDRKMAEKDAPIKRPRTSPTCCMIGCYEHRQPPSPYCILHENCGLEED